MEPSVYRRPLLTMRPDEKMEKNMISEIELLLKTNRYQEAIVLCLEKLSRTPDDPRLLYLLAIAYYKKEEYTEATQALEQVAVVQPNNIKALLLWAHISSWGYGDGYPKAVELYRRVLAINSQSIEAYIGLALMRRSPGTQVSTDESVQLLEHALTLDPFRPEVHNNLAYTYWETGEYQRAKEHFEKLLELSEPETRSIIQKELWAVNAHQRPQNLVYLGPSLSLLSVDE